MMSAEVLPVFLQEPLGPASDSGGAGASPALRILVDKYRGVALSDRPGSHIALACMNEEINMAIADATRGKLRLEN